MSKLVDYIQVVNSRFPNKPTIITFGIRNKFLWEPYMNPININCNFIIVKGDNNFYFTGIPNITKDLLETAELISNMAHSHSNYIITVGTSFGSYLALLFGYLLKANEIYIFGPVCNINPEFLEEINKNTILSKQYDSLNDNIKNINEMKPKINQDYIKYFDISHFKINSKIIVHYASKFQLDVINLELLKKLNDVDEIGYNTDKHGVPYKEYNNSGNLKKLFVEISNKQFTNNFQRINENGVFY